MQNSTHLALHLGPLSKMMWSSIYMTYFSVWNSCVLAHFEKWIFIKWRLNFWVVSPRVIIYIINLFIDVGLIVIIGCILIALISSTFLAIGPILRIAPIFKKSLFWGHSPRPKKSGLVLTRLLIGPSRFYKFCHALSH